MKISELEDLLRRARRELGDAEVVHAGSEWEMDVDHAWSEDGRKLVLDCDAFEYLKAKRWKWEPARQKMAAPVEDPDLAQVCRDILTGGRS